MVAVSIFKAHLVRPNRVILRKAGKVGAARMAAPMAVPQPRAKRRILGQRENLSILLPLLTITANGRDWLKPLSQHCKRFGGTSFTGPPQPPQATARDTCSHGTTHVGRPNHQEVEARVGR